MKDTKTELRFFTIPQWKQEEEYLRKNHMNGWAFVKVNSIGLYHFKKCEPADVIYQLDYNPESISHKDEYIQMFRDCGWEYLQNYVGYSYFRKAASEMDGKEEIFCDDSSRIDMMKRVFRGRLIPLLCIFFFVIIPQMFVQSQVSFCLFIIYCILFAVYLVFFTMFAVYFWMYYKSVHK